MDNTIEELANGIRQYLEIRSELLLIARSLEATIIEDFHKKHPAYYIDEIIYNHHNIINLVIKNQETGRIVNKQGILYIDEYEGYSYEFND